MRALMNQGARVSHVRVSALTKVFGDRPRRALGMLDDHRKRAVVVGGDLVLEVDVGPVRGQLSHAVILGVTWGGSVRRIGAHDHTTLCSHA